MGFRSISVLASAVVIALGGLAVTAYAGALPDRAQNAAHTLIAAPAADKGGHPHNGNGKGKGNGKDPATKKSPAPKSEHGKGPDATGPAASGLCNAWAHSAQRTKSPHRSVAMRNLARAAGGYDKIDSYCAHLPPRASKSEAPETEAPETEAPETEAPETEAPETSATD